MTVLHAEVISHLRFANVPDDVDWWVLLKPLDYMFEGGNEDFSFVETDSVPVDFITDLTSIPKLLRGFFPAHGEYSAAAVVHDYYYYKRKETREFADELFLALMKSLGVSWWKRRGFYYAVRLFGEKRWNEDTVKPVLIEQSNQPNCPPL